MNMHGWSVPIGVMMLQPFSSSCNRTLTPWLGEAVTLRIGIGTCICVDMCSQSFARYIHLGGEP